MIDDYVRRRLPRFVGPVLAVYRFAHLSPNAVTLLGLAVAVAAAAAVAQTQYVLALVLWWLSRVFDGTDGIYARQLGRTTDFGAYLDIIADMAAYSAMILGFSVAYPSLARVWLVILFLYLLCITSALALGALENNVSALENNWSSRENNLSALENNLGALENNLGALENNLSASRDTRGLRLGAGIAEAGETNLAYTVLLLFPSAIAIATWTWVGVLAVTVVARTVIAHRRIAGDLS